MSVINTNISSIQAQNSLRVTQLNQSTAMERLSSGVRINSAKDDAAGLAISTRMTANIRGIAAAVRNANDGISLTQTAEGSLGQIGDSLQRIRELAVQSSNTGNNASDRAAMNNEAKALIAEIDRVASNTMFNGIKLLDGSFQNQALQVGAGNDANDRITISVGSAKSSSLGVGSNSSYAATKTNSAVGNTDLTAGVLAINGFEVGAAQADGLSVSNSNRSGIAVAAAINAISGKTGVTATVGTTQTVSPTITGTPTAAATEESTINFKAMTTGQTTAVGGLTYTSTSASTAAQVAAAFASLTAGVAGATLAAPAQGTWSGTFSANFSTGATATGASGANTAITATAISTMAGMAVTDIVLAGTSTATATAVTQGAEGTGYLQIIRDDDIRVNGVNIGAISADTSVGGRGGQMAAAINAKSSQTGVTATFDTTTGSVQLTAADGRNIDISVKASSSLSSNETGLTHTATTGAGASTARTETTVRAEVSLSSTQEAGITVTDKDGSAATASGLATGYTAAVATAGAGVSSLDLSTAAGSQAALTTLDAAINTVTDSRAAMGAYQNRLTASISNLETTSQNLSASRSRIMDTDYAKESTNLAKAQIISQAATAMLAQANQSQQSVLALLK